MASHHSQEAQVNDVDKEWTRAVFLGDLDRLKELANKKAKQSGEGDLGNHFFSSADMGNTIASYKGLNGRSVFHIAAVAGRELIFKYLLEDLKLNVDDFIDDQGMTPLHSAIQGHQHSLAEYLLDNGANPNAEDNFRNTPFHLVANMGPQELLEYFINKGAEIDAKSHAGTPLQLAASKCRKDIMKVLLDNRANANVTSHGLWSPLNSSICNRSIECVKLLLQAGADPNFVSQGDAPLMIAALTDEVEIIKCLLDAGADPNVPNHMGHVPIQVAATLLKVKAVVFLFPVTSHISTISEWSIDGILQYYASNDATKKMTNTLMKNKLRSISRGDEALNRKEYREALSCYTKALLTLPPDSAIIYSKRSLCWARLNIGNYALEDALSCLGQRPNWPEAYNRAGEAWMVLKDYYNAADFFCKGWMLDANNTELGHAFLKASKAKREQSA